MMELVGQTQTGSLFECRGNLFSSLAFLSLSNELNDDAEAWKCATPFVEALSEQEVRYLPPTMAGWHLMAKVGVGRE